MNQEVNQAQNQTIQDNFTKSKFLMISLNKSLENLFEVATFQIRNNDERNAFFEKYYEEFNSIADQLELNLLTALKCVQQAENNRKYLSLQVNYIPQANSCTYEQFLNVAKAQIMHIQEVKNIILLKEEL